MQKLIKEAPFKIKEVQNDNGHEWIKALFGQKVPSPTVFEEEFAHNYINYRLIKVGTPKHNGRVERQHGLNMLRFYKNLKITSIEDAS